MNSGLPGGVYAISPQKRRRSNSGFRARETPQSPKNSCQKLLVAPIKHSNTSGKRRVRTVHRMPSASSADQKMILPVSIIQGLTGSPICPFCRSEEHTSELQSLMRTSYSVFCLKKKIKNTTPTYIQT